MIFSVIYSTLEFGIVEGPYLGESVRVPLDLYHH